MSVAVAEPVYSEEQYLTLERAADHKSEFSNGRIYAMAGATEPHVLVAGNLFAELHQQFKGRPCRAYSNDMRIRVSNTGLYTYPDVAALCGEPQFLDSHRDTLLNPGVIIEVLSPSTEAYDRGDKFAHYRTLSSLRDVLLISQRRVRVEHYARQGDQWLLATYDNREAHFPLESVGVILSIREIYDRVEFPPETPVPEIFQAAMD